MVRVELAVLIFIYLFAFAGAIFSIWILFEWSYQRREKEALRYRVRCTICASLFEDRSNGELARCPSCGSLNERVKTGGL